MPSAYTTGLSSKAIKKPLTEPVNFLKSGAEDDLGLGLENRLDQLNTDSSTIITPTQYGTREQYSPGVEFTSNDPLQGTIFEEGAILGLDPLGIFDVPQINTDIERLDPQALSDMVSRQARNNAIGSRALEAEIDPALAAARDESMEALLADIRGGGVMGGDLESLLSRFTESELGVPELQQSELLNSARSEAMRELNLGYELPQDIRNLVARTAAGRGSASGVLGGQAGRDIGARDLGLTSMDIFNQRMNRASGLGMQEEQTNIGQQGLAATIQNQNRMFQFGAGKALGDMRQREFMNRFGTAQFTQGIDRPMSGLDPGALASCMVGDVNQRNEIVGNANTAQLNAATDAKGNQLGMMGDVFSGVMGMMCWVAREVYEGEDTWKLFRLWLANEADYSLLTWYLKNGEEFALSLKNNPTLKPLIKWWMDRKVESIKGNNYGDWKDTVRRRLIEGH